MIFCRWMDETKEMRDGEAVNDVAHVERVVYRRIETFVTFLYQRTSRRLTRRHSSTLGSIDRSARADRGVILNRSLIPHHGKFAPSQKARQGGSR